MFCHWATTVQPLGKLTALLPDLLPGLASHFLTDRRGTGDMKMEGREKRELAQKVGWVWPLKCGCPQVLFAGYMTASEPMNGGMYDVKKLVVYCSFQWQCCRMEWRWPTSRRLDCVRIFFSRTSTIQLATRRFMKDVPAKRKWAILIPQIVLSEQIS